MEEMNRLTLKGFLDDLSSNSPAPGGGSAAALGASIGAALSAMVFNLTIGKKMYGGYEDSVKEEINRSLEKALGLKDEFMTLMDEDVAAFNKVMEAYRLPKETEDDKNMRNSKIQEAYIGAMEVPLKMARRSVEIFELLEVSAKYGNPNAISDAGVGALFALTSLESAILNVKINLSAIKESGIVDKVREECDRLLEFGRKKKEHILKLVEQKL